jgi:NADH-quinone oxidoreductase subunit M
MPSPDLLLTLITFLPLVGMGVVLALRDDARIKQLALGWSLVPLALATYLWFMYDSASGGLQFEFLREWIPSFGVNYHVGVDGFSVPLIWLTALLTTISLWYSAGTIHTRVKEFFALFLLLETGMFGVFVSLDLFMFYVFFEIGLVPMYFLIGIWGGPRREYAALKFFLYTLAGSVLMLLAIIAVAMDTGSFSIIRGPLTSALTETAALPFGGGAGLAAILTFLGFFIALAIKVPMWPFHTWLPDAHVEAPTAGSVILAGVLLKLGTYGFVRILMPSFPAAFSALAIPIAFLAFTSIVYGAFVAMAQWDFKKLIAYSSVNHMGYVILGLAAAMALSGAGVTDPAGLEAARATAVNAAVLQMFNHGIITGALFLLVGMIYDQRTHVRDFRELGPGMWRTVPRYGAFLIVAAFASLGLPGLAGFVSEFFVFRGAFGVALAGHNMPLLVLTVLSVAGIVVTAAFILWKVIQMLLLGPQNERWMEVSDLTRSEIGMLVPLTVLMFLFGVYPKPILDLIDSGTRSLLPTLNALSGESAAAIPFLLGLF